MVLTVAQRLEQFRIRKEDKEISLNDFIASQNERAESAEHRNQQWKLKRIGEIQKEMADDIQKFPNERESIEKRKKASISHVESIVRRESLKIKVQYSKKDNYIRNCKLDIELLEVQIDYLENKLRAEEGQQSEEE